MLSSVIEVYKNQPVTCLLLTSVVAILLPWFLFKGKKISDKKKPPNSIGFFRNVFEGLFSNEKQCLYFERLSKKYGKIFSLYVGIRYTVVVTDYEMMKEMGQMDAFTPRPPKIFEILEETPHFGDMRGNEWREQRRLYLKSLKSLGMGKSEGDRVIQEQIELFLNVLGKEVGRERVQLRPLINLNVTNTIFAMICSQTFHGNEIVDEYMEYSMKHSFQKSQWFFYPWLKLGAYFTNAEKKFKTNLHLFVELMRELVLKQEKTFVEGEKRDYIDFYLEEMKSEKLSSFNKGTLLGNIQLLSVTGSENIRTLLEWCLVCLANYQQVQERMHAEINNLIGKERMPEWNDRVNLPYSQAVILEVMRWIQIIPVNDPRWTREDVVFRNWIIPKNSVLLMNFYSVLTDSKIWGDPEIFRPERFLTNDGKGIENQIAERVCVFSLGKRNCPGERLAVVEIYLYLTCVLQRFHLVPCQDGSTEFKSQFAHELINPLVVIQKRPDYSNDTN